MPQLFRRKNIRLPVPNYQGPHLCFATLCFNHRAPLASDPAVADWLISTLRECALRKSFLVHAYCVMADHLHFLTEGTNPAMNVISLVRSFKQTTGYLFSQRQRQHLWQEKWSDHLLRNNESVEAVCWYIWLNPGRKRICTRPSEYPFLGSFSNFASRLDSPSVSTCQFRLKIPLCTGWKFPTPELHEWASLASDGV
ncbi:MAG: transposase, partial [Candidatus Acidiferrum sp.]